MSPFPPHIVDSHTHNLTPSVPSIVNIDVADVHGETLTLPPIPPGSMYSLGIHPWNAGRPDTPRLLAQLQELIKANRPLIAAVGECGLDTLKGPDLFTKQLPLFKAQIRIAAQHGLPLIIHCVKAWPLLIKTKQEAEAATGACAQTTHSAPTATAPCPTHAAATPNIPAWIIHGFRGKPQLASQLLAQGFTLSFGLRHNPQALALTPTPLRESDTPAAIE